MGVLFDVWTKLGSGHREKFYQRAAAEGLRAAGLLFREQVPVKVFYRDKSVGTYYYDFLIDDKVVLELKVREYFSKHDIVQLHSYLKAKKLKLGIIAHFTRRGVKFKRIVNLS